MGAETTKAPEKEASRHFFSQGFHGVRSRLGGETRRDEDLAPLDPVGCHDAPEDLPKEAPVK
jgi:hypothetical protein